MKEIVRIMDTRTYVAIDLKSFYASVACVERGLDPINNLMYSLGGNGES